MSNQPQREIETNPVPEVNPRTIPEIPDSGNQKPEIDTNTPDREREVPQEIPPEVAPTELPKLPHELDPE
ncbi:hypothetical protein FHS18_005608 [Paenibacillus phyllosphaerae]|uniref:Uncharacterized protein n=1 Tax=Paenibacillus phyllosphaerae TaxID=274593 RepID=A0A7W5B4E2_9BACL|nr:hypothetical protein [Paenibacillus phyllosphaerae]MBB3113496.1 hypothetical protein [Paenibacillus phyllosphaerae]